MQNKAGKILLIIGVLMLVCGIIAGLTIGTILVPILLASSILVNSVGITLLRSPGRSGRER